MSAGPDAPKPFKLGTWKKSEKSSEPARDSGSEPAYKRVAKTVARCLLGVLIGGSAKGRGRIYP